jgi:3-(3-hydroxy-phenyl)propionate hydroxylase
MSRIFEEPLYPYAPNRDQDPRSARRHRVAIVGAGPVGLALAIDLARQGVETVVVDDNDKVSWGSRAICFAKRPLEILDRLGCGEPMVEKGVVWNLGKVFFGDRQVYDFNLLPEEGHRRPAFINLQQYHFEKFLLDRLQALVGACAPVELRGGNKVVSIDSRADGATLQVETPDGI